MKKSIVTFFVLVVTLVSFAQNDTEHLTFKGVPIDGTLSEYVKKMKSAGFEYLEGGIDYAVLQGDFAGFKDCTVLISTLDAINVVSKICVLFPECNVWSSLEQNYNLLTRFGDENTAIQMAEKRLQHYLSNGQTTPSKMCPCTTLHHLIGEILRKTRLSKND